MPLSDELSFYNTAIDPVSHALRSNFPISGGLLYSFHASDIIIFLPFANYFVKLLII